MIVDLSSNGDAFDLLEQSLRRRGSTGLIRPRRDIRAPGDTESPPHESGLGGPVAYRSPATISVGAVPHEEEAPGACAAAAAATLPSSPTL